MGSWRPILAGVLVMACGTARPPPLATGPGQVANAADAGDPVGRCPDPDELAAVLRARWDVSPEATVETRCTPGRFPEPGWAISALLDEADDVTMRRVVLASDDRRVLAQTEATPVAPWYRADGGGLDQFSAVDFDGDGQDELTYEEEAHHGGTYHGSFVVLGVAGSQLIDLLHLVTADGNDEGGAEDPADEYACRVEVSIGEVDGNGRRTLIAVGKTVIGAPGRGGCLLGRTQYVLAGGAFTHQTR